MIKEKGSLSQLEGTTWCQNRLNSFIITITRLFVSLLDMFHTLLNLDGWWNYTSSPEIIYYFLGRSIMALNITIEFVD